MSTADTINRLLQAEREADAIIERARQNRTIKVREAKAAADEELRVFRHAEEQRFQSEYAALISDAGSPEVEKFSLAELANVEVDFSANAKTTSQYVAKKVLEIDVTPNKKMLALGSNC